MNLSKTPFFLSKPGIQDLDVDPRTSRIRLLGHVDRSTPWIAEASKLNVVAQKRRSRPTKICDEVHGYLGIISTIFRNKCVLLKDTTWHPK